MPSSWSESNRLHSSNMRSDSINDELDSFDHDAFDAEMEAMSEMDEDSARMVARMEAEYNAWEAAQLQRLDEIHDGDR